MHAKLSLHSFELIVLLVFLAFQEVACAQAFEFIKSISRPPLLKYHPAAPFLVRYDIDDLGMSVTENPEFTKPTETAADPDKGESIGDYRIYFIHVADGSRCIVMKEL